MRRKMILKKPQEIISVSQDGFTLRSATEEDMTAIFLMGRDAWGSKAKEVEYLEMCRNSEKYQSGNWSILTLHDGRPLSSVISYTLSENAPACWVGIGSLATVINERFKGYARVCLSMLMASYELQQNVSNFMLFSDIQSGIYVSAGFRNAKSSGLEEQASNLMIKTGDLERAGAQELLRQYIHYF